MSFTKDEREKVKRLLKDSKIFNSDKGDGIYKVEVKNKEKKTKEIKEKGPFPFILQNPENNLYSEILDDCKEYFKINNIEWNGYEPEMTNHTLSSQVACLNHLFALRHDKEAVLSILCKINPKIQEALPLNKDENKPLYIDFEVISHHLNEEGGTRGAFCTSIDAVMLGRTEKDKILFPIEWKYTETYKDGIDLSKTKKEDGDGNGQTRINNYDNLIDNSPYLNKVNKNIMYIEPFYQLMRQTLWAEQMIKHNETETIKADDFFHIHVIPTENKELLDKEYKSNAGMEETWRSCITNQEKYRIITPEELLSPIRDNSEYQKLIEYLNTRYWNSCSQSSNKETDFKKVVTEVKNLLDSDIGWQEKFEDHIQGIKINIKTIRDLYSKFRSEKPFTYYISTSKAKSGTYTFEFSMRYVGQEVATVKASSKKGITITSKTETNNKNFDCNIKLDNSNWDSKEASAFRRFFKKKPERINIKKRNEEHNIESKLITELSKKKGKEKLLLNIQPVMISESLRFPMPTSLSASGIETKLKNNYNGGGIDILCRHKKKLCIIELKDEYNPNEPPEKAMKQALAYATFIRELLRSESGNDWYKFYGFTSNVPKNLLLKVVVAMPHNENGKDDISFEKKQIKIDNDILELHYMYFDKELTRIESSLNE